MEQLKQIIPLVEKTNEMKVENLGINSEISDARETTKSGVEQSLEEVFGITTVSEELGNLLGIKDSGNKLKDKELTLGNVEQTMTEYFNYGKVNTADDYNNQEVVNI